MLRKLLVFLMALALFNLIVFIIVFFWSEFGRLMMTPNGIFLTCVVTFGAATPFVVTRIGNYQRKRKLRKRWCEYKVRQHFEQRPRNPGIDF